MPRRPGLPPRGEHLRPEAFADEGDEKLFVIFDDRANDEETYGAGRFLYVERPDPDGTTWIDFSKAYNPRCAFTLHATCPLPPEGSLLPIRVTAGEKKYGENH